MTRPDESAPSPPPPDSAAPSALEGAPGRGESVRFVVLFLVLFGALYGTLTYWGVAREYVVDPWTRLVAYTSWWVLHLFDPQIFLDGNYIFTRGHGIHIIDGCNGITPLSLLVAGVLAFPTRWRARAWGFAIGIPAVVLVNLVRIMALWYLGLHYPDWFDESHLYIAQAFVILATGGVWLWWLGRFAAPPPPPNSGGPGATGGPGEETDDSGAASDEDGDDTGEPTHVPA